MRPPCEIITQTFLPLIRGLVARKLTMSMTQKEAAEKMGVSQPTISSYLKSLSKLEAQNEEYLTNDSVLQLVNLVEEKISKQKSPEEIIKAICQICVSLRVSGLTCRKHITNYPELETGCSGCLPLIEKTTTLERRKILVELQEAAQILGKEERIVSLMPQVMLNICLCTKSAKSIDDVAAFPGRITKVKGKARALLPPEFGVSKHLAKLLLQISNMKKGIRSVICLKNDEKVHSKLERSNIPVFSLQNNGFMTLFFNPNNTKKTILPEKFTEFLSDIKESTNKPVFAVVNEGGIGIEPITYLFASSALQVVRITLQLLD